MHQPQLPVSFSPLNEIKRVFNRIGIVMSIMLIIGCNTSESGKEGSEEKEAKTNESNTQEIKIDTVLQKHNKDKSIVSWDTIVSNNVKIQIQYLPSGKFVRQDYSYEEENQYIVDRYYYDDVKLTISKGKRLLFDTILKKEHFKKRLNPEFYEQCIPVFYTFEDFRNNEIRLFGSLGVPETDWYFNFYDYFNLQTNTLRSKEVIWHEYVLPEQISSKSKETLQQFSEENKFPYKSYSENLFWELFPFKTRKMKQPFHGVNLDSSIINRVEFYTSNRFNVYVEFDGLEFSNFEIIKNQE